MTKLVVPPSGYYWCYLANFIFIAEMFF